MINSPRVTIHLNNILKNYQLAKTAAPNSQIMAVVKANAYGHGVVQVCEKLECADAFAVARVSEGIELRNAGITHKIIILEGFIGEVEKQACSDYKLCPVIHSYHQLILLDSELPVWVKINSGMNRLGFNIKEVKKYQTEIRSKHVIGLMSHFASAELPGAVENRKQEQIFKQALALLKIETDVSFANSDCILKMPENHFDWIRPGIMLYGSSVTVNSDSRLLPTMTLTAPIIAIHDLDAGSAIGYGSSWVAPGPSRVAVVGLGYADGYPREMPAGTPVLVRGKRRHLVGRISMDMLFIALGPDDAVEVGDDITFWGCDLPIDEIAACAGTIAYTLMTGITPRVQRLYE